MIRDIFSLFIYKMSHELCHTSLISSYSPYMTRIMLAQIQQNKEIILEKERK